MLKDASSETRPLDSRSFTISEKATLMFLARLLQASVCLVALSCSYVFAQGDAALGEITFRESFDRVNSDELMDEVGNGWSTNSKARAQGDKQADLRDGYLNMTTSPKADHASTVRHDFKIKNGSFQAKIRLHDQKGVNFQILDSAYKQSHAGHITEILVRPKSITLQDGKTGAFAFPFYTQKKAGELSKEQIAAHMDGKQAKFDCQIPLEEWQTIAVTFKDDVMTVYLNGNKLGQLKSEGIAHETKVTFLFDVPGSADIDDVELRTWDKK